MERLNLLIGLTLGLVLTGCPGDDTTDDGAGTTAGNDSTTTNTTPGTTMQAEDTTTTGEPSTTTGEPSTTTEEPSTTTEEPSTTTEEPTTDTTTGEPALSFAADVYPIIMANCSCHVEGGSGMLPMPDADTAYGNLVDVPSANMTNGQDRIEPGDPDASFLWHKVNGTLEMGEGSRMPLMAMPLDAALLATIEEWIMDGAEP